MNIKNAAVLALAAVLCLSATACGNSGSSQEKSENASSIADDTSSTADTEQNSEITADSAANSNTALSDNLMDFQVSINGKVLSFPCTPKDLIDAGLEVERNHGGKIYADKVNWKWFECGDVTFTLYLYNFSGKDYDLMESLDTEDVYVTGGMISGDFSTADIILSKGINLNNATVESIVEAYGTPDIDDGRICYFGEHFSNNIERDSDDCRLYHKDGEAERCNYFWEFCSNDNNTKIKSVVLESSEEIYNLFYEKYPEQKENGAV